MKNKKTVGIIILIALQILVLITPVFSWIYNTEYKAVVTSFIKDPKSEKGFKVAVNIHPNYGKMKVGEDGFVRICQKDEKPDEEVYSLSYSRFFDPEENKSVELLCSKQTLEKIRIRNVHYRENEFDRDFSDYAEIFKNNPTAMPSKDCYMTFWVIKKTIVPTAIYYKGEKIISFKYSIKNIYGIDY